MAEYIPTTATVSSGTKFKDMGVGAKIVFTGKSLVFLLTMGFAFPRIWSD